MAVDEVEEVFEVASAVEIVVAEVDVEDAFSMVGEAAEVIMEVAVDVVDAPEVVENAKVVIFSETFLFDF